MAVQQRPDGLRPAALTTSPTPTSEAKSIFAPDAGRLSDGAPTAQRSVGFDSNCSSSCSTAGRLHGDTDRSSASAAFRIDRWSGWKGAGPSWVSFAGAGRVIAAAGSRPGSLVRAFQFSCRLRQA